MVSFDKCLLMVNQKNHQNIWCFHQLKYSFQYFCNWHIFHSPHSLEATNLLWLSSSVYSLFFLHLNRNKITRLSFCFFLDFFLKLRVVFWDASCGFHADGTINNSLQCQVWLGCIDWWHHMPQENMTFVIHIMRLYGELWSQGMTQICPEWFEPGSKWWLWFLLLLGGTSWGLHGLNYSLSVGEVACRYCHQFAQMWRPKEKM